MSLQTKALLLGGAGIVSSVTYGLVQPKSSLSVREQMGIDDYVLISEKTNISEQAWKDRASIYKENSEWLLEGLSHAEVSADGKRLEKECEKYTQKDVSINSLSDGVYKKLTKLCTLNIKEYIESRLDKAKGEKIIEKDEANDWDAIYEKHKTEIDQVIKDIRAQEHKDKLNKFCEDAFKLQKSKENKEKEYQANQWCVKHKEAPKPIATNSSDSASD